MSCPNDAINFHCYRVRQGTELHQAITSYHQKCVDFIQYAQKLVKKYDANSAHMLFGIRRVVVDGLHYTDEKAPLAGWFMDCLGYFKPIKASKFCKDFAYVLPYFEIHYPKAGHELRASKLGDTIIAVLPDHGDGVKPLGDGDYLDKAAYNALLETATKTQKEHISEMGRIVWIPLPLFKNPVFEPSDEVKELNNERCNKRGDFKYSRTGRYFHRGVQNLAAALHAPFL
ncbi:MAG: hypothetical protein WC612_05325 [Bdellovibrionales bacterium]|jgi:hypothetical protein